MGELSAIYLSIITPFKFPGFIDAQTKNIKMLHENVLLQLVSLHEHTMTSNDHVGDALKAVIKLRHQPSHAWPRPRKYGKSTPPVRPDPAA